MVYSPNVYHIACVPNNKIYVNRTSKIGFFMLDNREHNKHQWNAIDNIVTALREASLLVQE
jgi:hypothetical protein